MRKNIQEARPKKKRQRLQNSIKKRSNEATGRGTVRKKASEVSDGKTNK